MFNSNIGPKWAPLRHIRLQNSLVKSNGAIGLPIYDFLLVPKSNYMSNWHCLGVIGTWKNFYLLSLGPKFADTTPTPPSPTLTPGRFLSKWNHFISGSHRRSPSKMKLIGSVLFQTFCWHTDRYTHAHTQDHCNKPLAGINNYTVKPADTSNESVSVLKRALCCATLLFYRSSVVSIWYSTLWHVSRKWSRKPGRRRILRRKSSWRDWSEEWSVCGWSIWT